MTPFVLPDPHTETCDCMVCRVQRFADDPAACVMCKAARARIGQRCIKCDREAREKLGTSHDLIDAREEKRGIK